VKEIMDLKQYAGTRYIRVEDLERGPRRKTIAGVDLGQWDRPVLTFADGSRLSLCATNVMMLRIQPASICKPEWRKEKNCYSSQALARCPLHIDRPSSAPKAQPSAAA
jgi:hypothetical protein